MSITEDSEHCIFVLDLPQLYQKPSYEILRSTLFQLTKSPQSWDSTVHELNASICEDGVPSYLTRIISSPLSWLGTDEQRENVWAEAARRLSERSGRSGMSSLERSFHIPSTRQGKSVTIKLHEPALVEDHLGHKTWLSSYLLAKRMPCILSNHFDLAHPSSQEVQLPAKERLRMLELGAGTGLTGLAAASLYPYDISMLLTDLPCIIPNLESNVKLNSAKLCQGSVRTGILDWSKLPQNVAEKDKYDCIIAADSIYSAEHPIYLVEAIASLLAQRDWARAVFSLPLRPGNEEYHPSFRLRMNSKNLTVCEEGVETGIEDWHVGVERQEVQCWWSVWRWKDKYAS